MGLNNLNEVPFSEVFIHPKIQDGFGETMSKSKGNGIDPLDVIDKFGADALRFGMAHLTTETQDVRLPVQFECPHCEHSFDQTKKNRVLPRVKCPSCKQEFSTQWAASPEDKALPRGAVLSERFEVARNFVNKLWNASRFAMMNLDGYVAAPIRLDDMTIEDRWMLSRLSTVSQIVTEKFERYHYAEATRELYDFAWDNFCSFYVEMLKDRFTDQAARPHAQRMLAYTLDSLLRLLHPVMPFITEEIWQNLAKLAPQRGLTNIGPASECLIVADWPALDTKWQDANIESQFAVYQKTLGALREIRARQNLAPKKQIQFAIRCDGDVVNALQTMASYFKSMAAAELTKMGVEIEPPAINATVALPEMEIYVDLAGLIDVGAERKRLEKELGKVQGAIKGKEAKLANEKFVGSAPAEIVARERTGLTQLQDQLTTIKEALDRLGSG